jgi:flavin-binding protein dodecin
MSVVKVIELVGSPNRSWLDAVKSAVRRAAKTVRNIRGVDVMGWTGKLASSRTSCTGKSSEIICVVFKS